MSSFDCPSEDNAQRIWLRRPLSDNSSVAARIRALEAQTKTVNDKPALTNTKHREERSKKTMITVNYGQRRA